MAIGTTTALLLGGGALLGAGAATAISSSQKSKARKSAQDQAQARTLGRLDQGRTAAQRQNLFATEGGRLGQELQEGTFRTPQGRRIFGN